MRLALTLLVALWLVPTPSLAEEIHACTKGGRILIVEDSSTCPGSSTPLVWNVEGPPGPVQPTIKIFDAAGNELGVGQTFALALFPAGKAETCKAEA